MSLLSFISVFSAALALVMGVVVLMRNPDNRLHRVFFLLSLLVSFVAFAEFGFRQAESEAVASFWLRLSQGAPIIIPMVVYFVGLFTESIPPDAARYFAAVLFIPAIAFITGDLITNILSGSPLRTSWGWVQNKVHNPWYHVYAVWSTVLLSIAAFMSIRHYLISHQRKKRDQAKYVAMAVSLIVVVTVVIDTGMNYSKIQLPEYATLAYALANLLIAYAIRRHQLFILSPVAASDVILETMSDGLFLVSTEGVILHVNKAGRMLFGEDAETIQGKRLEDFIVTDAPLLKRFDSGSFGIDAVMGDMPAASRPVHAKKIPLSIAGKTMYDENGEVLGTVLTIRDISERVEADRAIRESRDLLEERVRQRTEELRLANATLAEERERLAITLRSIGDGVITADLQGRVVFLNHAAEQLTGWHMEEAAGRPVREVLKLTNENERTRINDPVTEVIASGTRTELSPLTRLTMRNGETRIVDDSAAPLCNNDGAVTGAVVVFRDVTEKMRLEEELFRVKRMESVALLAGGIAHDFNNLLTGINNNLFMCKVAARSDTGITGIINETEREILRAQQLAMQLLTFAHGGEPILEVCSPRALIEGSIGFFMSGSRSTYELRFDDDLMNIRTDKGMMEQVLSNLILNAEQAMPGGGNITVTVGNASIDEKRVDREKRVPIHLPAGIYVRINIRDVGTGIPIDLRDKVFDPFFSTKGKGRGLGLSIAQSIIEKHKGTIIIEPDVDRGTSFLIYLPAVEASAPEQVDMADSRSPVPVETGGEKILLMDDEEVIRRTTARILEMMGYRVETAAHGAEAVALYRSALQLGVPFDLVILDLTIPGKMGGRECLEKLVQIDPLVKAIVSSGYSTDAVMADYARYGFKGVLRKPYVIKSLEECVRGVLG